jgi:amino acid synthesis protein
MAAAMRKVVFLRELVFAELGETAARPVTRVAALAVLANPLAGHFVADLRPLWLLGGKLGEQLMPELAALLGAPAASYGKGAIVGVNGEVEHGGACVHPMLGRPMRAAIGGGEAVIPSNVKVAAAGAALDLPLGQKDDPWSFAHFDTMTVMVPDAPRPDEIVVALALADGGRLNNRCGEGPVR